MIVLPNARRLVSPPSEEPITLQMAKDHCIVRHNEDDALFKGWIAAARYIAERLTGEKFISQQWEYTFPRFPSRREKIKIPAKPAQTVDSIYYTDEAGAETLYGTLSGSPLVIEEYNLVRDTEQPYIALKLNQAWPSVAVVDDAVKVTVTVGHEDDAVAFLNNPQLQLLRAGMLLLIAHFNENREAVVVTDDRNVIEIPLGIRYMLTVPRVG